MRGRDQTLSIQMPRCHVGYRAAPHAGLPDVFAGVVAELTAIIDEPPIEVVHDDDDDEQEEGEELPRELVWMLALPCQGQSYAARGACSAGVARAVGRISRTKWHCGS